VCYQIYLIGYRISDEIKRRKENEKPFWWNNLHPEVAGQPIEDIEKTILEVPQTNPEKVKEMSKHEKFLVASAMITAVQLEENAKQLAELEELKRKQAEPSDLPDTSFLNAPAASPNSNSTVTPTGTKLSVDQNLLGTAANGEVITSNDGKGGVPKPMQSLKSSLDIDDDYINSVSSRIKDEELDGVTKHSPYNKNLKDVGSVGNAGLSSPSGKTGMSAAEIRRHAQAIVKNAVGQINAAADDLPPGISEQNEDDLLNSVVEELARLQRK
jgi:hypothetical protein